jgi:hypothetical protein
VLRIELLQVLRRERGGRNGAERGLDRALDVADIVIPSRMVDVVVPFKPLIEPVAEWGLGRSASLLINLRL